MRDLIERQAAIRKLKRMATQAYIDKLNGKAETIINCCIDVIERQIPSAQPESEERKAESAQNVPKEDLISRKAAIDAVEHITSSMSVCVNTDECHGMKRMQRQAVIELANLPSAQPEPLVKESRTLVKDLVKDTISRQATIDALVKAIRKDPYYDTIMRAERRADDLQQ